MGQEYRFVISIQDKKNLNLSIDKIKDLTALLSSAPNFIEHKAPIFFYSVDPKNGEIWSNNIQLEREGFILCFYHSDALLWDYLRDEILARCGRLEIYDA